MPNWICNHLTIEGENALEVFRSLLVENENSDFGYDLDFNKITPMPEELNIVSGSITRSCAGLYINAMQEGCDAYKKYAALYVQSFGKDLAMSEFEQAKAMESALSHKDFETKQPMFRTRADVYAYGKRALDNYAKHGAKDWYDWCREHWGTKWNACDTQINDIDKADVYFNTAWSPPIPVLDTLSKRYPKLTFEYEFADEDTSYHTGDMTIRNGEIIAGGFLEDGSNEAYETYFRLWGGETDYRFNTKTGKYESIDEEVM